MSIASHSLDQIRPSKAGKLCKSRIDGSEHHWIGPHLETHGMTVGEYIAKYPKAPTCSRWAYDQWKETRKGLTRTSAAEIQTVTTHFGGLDLPVNYDVPEMECLPLPDHYQVPQHGTLSADIQEATIHFACKRSTYISGPPGTGKDGFWSAICALTRTPSKIFTIDPSADVLSWLYTRAFDDKQTYWEEGELLKALRDGYVSPMTGRRIPYLIVLSDFDRATKAQAEMLRLILDSIQGRVKGPNGETYKVLEGTRIVATANSQGSGDTTGRYISANPIDASLMDRFERKIIFHSMDWKDEEKIIRAKFPLLNERLPAAFPAIGKATQAIREAIKADQLYTEFSHRTVCAWAGAAEDILRVQTSNKLPRSILKRAARSFLDGMGDEETRTAAKRLVDPHVKGGALDAGDTSHIGKSPLSNFG